MEKNQVTKEMKETLLSVITSYGLFEALSAVFGNSVKVQLQWSEEELQTPLSTFEFTTRPSNALHNAHVETVGELLTLMENGKLDTLRNIGKKSLAEVRGKLLAFNFQNLTLTEKLEFCANVIALNCTYEEKLSA